MGVQSRWKGSKVKNFHLKKSHPRPLFRLFSSSQTNITILTTNKCEKVLSVYSAGIQTQDLQYMY